MNRHFTLPMNIRILALLLTLSCCVSTARAFETIELRQPGTNKIAIRLMFRNGSACDPEGKEGLMCLTASLLTEGGTESMSAANITKTLYPMAVRMGSSIDKEVSIVSFEFLKEHFERFYPILRDMVLAPGFRQEDIDRVSSNQLNYLTDVIRQSSDEEFGKKWLEARLFSGTRYAHLVEGSVTGLKGITRGDITDCYKTYFTRGNLLLGIAGDYTTEQLSLLQSDLQKLPDTPVKCNFGSVTAPSGFQVSIVEKEGAMGSAISAGFPMSLTRSSDQFAALMIANSWLGEHRKSYSRLYQKIREARSMNYGDYTYIEWYENGGSNMLPPPGTPRSMNYFSIWLRPVQTVTSLKSQYPELKDIEIGHSLFALRMAIREIDQLIKTGMSEKDFEETRSFLKSYTRLYAQTPARRLAYMMDSRFYGRQDWLNELGKLLEKATREDVNAAIREFWQTKNMHIAIITEPKESRAIQNALAEQRSTPVSYSNTLSATLPASILEEDKLVEKYPLPPATVEVVTSDVPFQ